MRTRRHDPERRSRIIDAALRCVAADGVAGTSYRKVAAIADVPLGSVTYHFSDMDDLLVQAFTRHSERIAMAFRARMEQVSNAEEAIEALVALVHEDMQEPREDLVIAYELYTLAARRPEYRAVTQTWMAASRRALEFHIDPRAARRVDAYIEGAVLHIALDPHPQSAAETRASFRALARLGEEDLL